MTYDGPPPRHLHPVDQEPPYDPAYDQPTTRRPPNDRAAERAVLAALLDDPNAGPRLAPHLTHQDFYLPIHGDLWDTWHTLATTTGTPPDHVTLHAHLTFTGRADLANLLPDLIGACPNTLKAEEYASTVRDCARLRAVVTAGERLTQLGYSADVHRVDTYLGEALQKLDETVMRFGPATTQAASGYKDLSWILTGQPPAIDPPTWVRHQAGHALFYAGKVNGIFGDPETAKTWLAQCAIIEALTNGGTAAMIDVDHNGENHTAARLMLLGARPEHLADPDRFRYYDPQEALELRGAITDITARRPDIVLIDSLGEVFPMLGLNTNDGDEITGGLRLLSQPAETGSCVIFIDHLPKGTEARASGFAIGSIAKKRAIRGSYIRAEESTKPAPGQVGKINLFIEKDTSGELRKATPGGKYVGKFVLDSTQPHITTWRVERDEAATTPDGRFRPTRVMERVSRYIEDNDQCSGRDIKDAVGGKADHVGKAIKFLIDEGFVSVHQGARRAMLHHSISLYREAEDDNLE